MVDTPKPVRTSGLDIQADSGGRLPAETSTEGPLMAPPPMVHATPTMGSAGMSPPPFHNAPVTNVATTVNVGGPNILISQQKRGVPFILRAVWFLFIGFWLSAVFIIMGYFFVATIIFAPLGFWFLNRIPQAQTLRMRNTEYRFIARDGYTELTEATVQQIPWYYRALYFPVGLVVGLIWLSLAWVISLPVITLPISIWMIDRSPAVISLQRH